MNRTVSESVVICNDQGVFLIVLVCPVIHVHVAQRRNIAPLVFLIKS